MAGGGSIQGMITSLSNNKKLLRRNRLFRPENSFLNLKKEYLKAAEGKINIKKATKKELAEIRRKVLEQRRKEDYITAGLFAASLMFIGLLISIIIKDMIIFNNETQQIELKNRTDQYLELIADGDQSLAKRKWYNAIYQYKKALEVFPKEYDINYRLASAYCYRCEIEFKDCTEAKEQLNKLLKEYPEKPDLLRLREILKFEYHTDYK